MSIETLGSELTGEHKLDQWPKSADGTDWDGAGLLHLLERGKNPFRNDLNVESLMHDLEHSLGATIEDVPLVTFGANHFGFSIILKDGRNIIARVSRGDMNKPGFDSNATEQQIKQDHFELAAYDALAPLGKPFTCRPVYHRDPKKSDDHALTPNRGRRLFLFQKAGGDTYDYPRWRALTPQQKVWERAVGGSSFSPVRIEPTRAFCISLMTGKIEATVGRRAREVEPLAIYQSVEMARKNLIQLVPLLLPKSSSGLNESAMYRFVLDHGDFGIHNMTVAMDAQGQPRITSVYDWEGGRIVPAILCEPKMVTTVDLAIDDKGKPNISRWGDGDTPDKMAQYRRWAEEYYKVFFSATPELKRIIETGREARRLWFALCDGHSQDLDGHFRQLGVWAGKKVTQLEGREETKRKLASMLCEPAKPVYNQPARSTVI